MSIKLFGGFAKGYTLLTPNSNSFRPTLITLRRKFFDKYQDLSDYNFYDLCAGSGAVALEAISHGASHAHAIEKNPKHFSILKSNISNFCKKYERSNIKYSKEDGLKWFEDNLSMVEDSKNIFFFDPPYEMKQLYEKFFALLKTCHKIEAVILIEADRQKSFDVSTIEEQFEVHKVFKQGSSYIAML